MHTLRTLFATALAALSDRLLAAVFPVRLVDPIAFALAVLGLLIAVAAAMMIRARHATWVDPAVVLRQD